MASKTPEIIWALSQFDPASSRMRAYKKFSDYYDGDQPLAFATSKYRSQFWVLFKDFADNMCQSVVDVQAERLEVIGFTSDTAHVEEVEVGPHVTISLVNDPMGDTAWDAWEDENMDLVADQVHSDSLLYGDGFLIVDSSGVWRQEPSEMAVKYSKEKPGTIELAAKMWQQDDKTVRLNIYTADGVTRYITNPRDDLTEKVTASALKLMPSATGEAVSLLDQGIPVAHFPNRAYGRYGRSELCAVLPLQDALNKAHMDLIVSMEYQAFRQRWLTGVEVELDENGMPKGFVGNHGPGEFLALPNDEAKVGEFDQADIAPFTKVINDLRGQIARVSGIPLHYFFVESAQTPSGEALKTGEKRFSRKSGRQKRCFGKTWENAMKLVIEVASDDDGESSYTSGTDLNVVWGEDSPRSESEEMDVLLKKMVIGIPNSQLQKEAGYDPDQVMQFGEEYAEQIRLGLVAAGQQAADKLAQMNASGKPGESPASVAAGGQGGSLPATNPRST